MPHPASLLLLFVLFGLLPYLSARTHKSGQILEMPRRAIYLSAVITQWLIVLLLIVVLFFEGKGAASIGLRAPTGLTATLAWSLATLVAGGGIAGILMFIRRRLGQAESAMVRHLLPRTSDERRSFALLVCPTAGIAEEILYRGFAVTRLAPLVGGEWPAAVLTSVAFSLGHVYQGTLGVLRAGILGFVLAVPFIITGSLIPSIIAHAVIDLLSGIVFQKMLLDE